eukprot:CAMPEP_0204380064 /NCGR_PEP_ID=MMETSP0469-20131031/53079_1 /ASSEMBLY_ACC=CAM_ASM_000384 /TAXON_ID=2969 /ORGANISM="Oxyrrhis marina" /LENGTH=100 /DNA_ID=CAMNT_0051371635 /DNA_START=1 /DNA_END=300 /DNA_ORIENTATION=+
MSLNMEPGLEVEAWCPTWEWPSLSLRASPEKLKDQAMMCFFLFLSFKDMFADSVVFCDLYFNKEWPVLAGCLAASVILPQILTWALLKSASMSGWTDFGL